MSKRKKTVKNKSLLLVIGIIILLFILVLARNTNFHLTTTINKTNVTNVTKNVRPFQENISIKIPPGVVRIGKGRIRTV